MSESGTATLKISIHLITPGVGVRDYHLPEGATLADLLRQSATSTRDQAIFIHGLPADEPWRAVVPAFRDEALFQEYSEILKARRFPGKVEGQGG
jgi:hypothetical protein